MNEYKDETKRCKACREKKKAAMNQTKQENA